MRIQNSEVIKKKDSGNLGNVPKLLKVRKSQEVWGRLLNAIKLKSSRTFAENSWIIQKEMDVEKVALSRIQNWEFRSNIGTIPKFSKVALSNPY